MREAARRNRKRGIRNDRMNLCGLVLVGEELFETLLRSLLNFDRVLVDHTGPGDEILSSIDRKSSHGNAEMISIRRWMLSSHSSKVHLSEAFYLQNFY